MANIFLNNSPNFKLLIGYIENSCGGNKSLAARNLKMSYRTLYSWIAGEVIPKMDVLQEIAERVKKLQKQPAPLSLITSPSTGTSPLVLSPANVSVNVYAVAGAGPAWDYSEEEPLFVISVPENLASKATFSFLVKGDSMYPTIKDDAVVGIKTDEPFISNEIYAIRIPYEGVSIKRVLVDVKNEEYVIKSDNPDKIKFADRNIPIAVAPDLIIGKVVWIWQKC